MPSNQLAARGLAVAIGLAISSCASAGSAGPATAPVTPVAFAAPKGPPAVMTPHPKVGPLPVGEKAAWSHAPFEAGDCGTCHQREDPKNPGPVRAGGNELCFTCHEELQASMAAPYKHRPAVESCTYCHNPHNSRQRKLLVSNQEALCFGCHKKIATIASTAKVKHAALTTGEGCTNCHNPHGANVEKILIELPFDLCVKCHSTDGVSDGRGGTLTNFKKFLQVNRVWHRPVEAKDCSACHRTHGSDNFRLLVAEYPASFYAPFDPKNYKLCFGCHNSRAVTEAQTTTFTSFRDGATNLHFVHVNKSDRGRTCRACHEVHASKQDHHVREGVPYGKRNWMLKLNFTKTATGGSCAKTCHDTRTYRNVASTNVSDATGVAGSADAGAGDPR